MPKYFFDVHDGKGFVDDEGVELATLAEVRAEAIKSAGEMLKDQAEVWSDNSWTMEVRDEQGEIVTTLIFSAS